MNAEQFVRPVADEILKMADEAEATRRLPDGLMTTLKEAGLFSLYTPRKFGGMELPLPDALSVVEEVSRFDGSTGWTVALGFGNDLFTSALSDEAAARIFRNGSALIAGAPGFGVRAVPVKGGYQISGRWSFCSGSPNADWMSVAAPIFDGDAPRTGPTDPALVFAFLPPSEVEIIDTWHVTGLRASGTQDLQVNNVFVPEDMTGQFSMPAGPRPVRASTLAHLPFFSALGIAQSPPVCLGGARHAIAEFREMALRKERPFAVRLSDQVPAQVGLARAEALVDSARAYFYQEVGRAWEAMTSGAELGIEARARLRMSCVTAAENSVAALGLLYRLAGTSAVFTSSPIERCWRDVHTAAQHLSVQDSRWETVGRVLFGLEPNSPFL